MSTQSSVPRRFSIHDLKRMKVAGEKIAMVTAYDATFARLLDEAGADAILVGDSLGMVVQGHETTLPVTLEQMIYHSAAVRRGLVASRGRAHVIGDMPFGSYQAGADEAVRIAFTSLVHPREAIIRFCPARARLTDDPEAELQRLFNKYVNRAFATPEYVEKEMGKRLSTLLKGLNLQVPFRPVKIGDDDVHAWFPLVQRSSAEFLKVIKLFNLTNQNRTTFSTMATPGCKRCAVFGQRTCCRKMCFSL